MGIRPKLNDVARVSGVSEATASRVINGRPGVAEATRRRVLDALSELGYRDAPSQARKTGIVGIVTPELDNPIFPVLAQSIETRLARHEFVCVICPSTSETINEQDYLDHLAESGASGAVIINGRYASAGLGYAPYEELIKRGLRVVLVNAVERPCPVPAVSVNIAAGAEAAVRHLAALGHERIGCLVGPRRYTTSLDFADGWRKGMHSRGLEYSDALISETLFTIEGGQAGTARLLEAGATGLVAASDMMAIGAIRGARTWGADVPSDVSVVGFDGTQIASLTDPPLTTVRQPIDQLASAAAKLFLSPADSPMPPVQLFNPDLVVGRSTGPVKTGVTTGP